MLVEGEREGGLIRGLIRAEIVARTSGERFGGCFARVTRDGWLAGTGPSEKVNCVLGVGA